MLSSMSRPVAQQSTRPLLKEVMKYIPRTKTDLVCLSHAYETMNISSLFIILFLFLYLISDKFVLSTSFLGSLLKLHAVGMRCGPCQGNDAIRHVIPFDLRYSISYECDRTIKFYKTRVLEYFIKKA